MRSTLEYIAEKRRAFAACPFFAFLRDRRLSPAARFSFAPAAAPFVMAFSDLNRMVLHQAVPPGASDPIQEILNTHSREDDSHFRLYLADLVTLGLDAPMRFTEALEMLWSDDRRSVRRTCYALTALLASASPRLRLVVVEAIEATGAEAFATFREVADEHEAATGKELRYFGRRHEALETGHAMGTADIEGELHTIPLSEPERAEARRVIDVVFRCFEEMMAEVLRYSQVATKRT